MNFEETQKLKLYAAIIIFFISLSLGIIAGTITDLITK